MTRMCISTFIFASLNLFASGLFATECVLAPSSPDNMFFGDKEKITMVRYEWTSKNNRTATHFKLVSDAFSKDSASEFGFLEEEFEKTSVPKAVEYQFESPINCVKTKFFDESSEWIWAGIVIFSGNTLASNNNGIEVSGFHRIVGYAEPDGPVDFELTLKKGVEQKRYYFQCLNEYGNAIPREDFAHDESDEFAFPNGKDNLAANNSRCQP